MHFSSLAALLSRTCSSAWRCILSVINKITHIPFAEPDAEPCGCADAEWTDADLTLTELGKLSHRYCHKHHWQWYEQKPQVTDEICNRVPKQ